jgi:hypothetical protein
MVGFGAAKSPQDFHFLVLVAGKAGNEHQKRMILGGHPEGTRALQTSSTGDRVSRDSY